MTFLGWLSDPFQWLSDLQLGDEKVTLNHLAATFLVFLFFLGGKNSQTEGLRTISATGCCLQCSKPWSFSWVKVNNYPVIKKTGQFHSGFLGSPFVRVPRSHCSTSNIFSDIWSFSSSRNIYCFTADFFWFFSHQKTDLWQRQISKNYKKLPSETLKIGHGRMMDLTPPKNLGAGCIGPGNSLYPFWDG